MSSDLAFDRSVVTPAAEGRGPAATGRGGLRSVVRSAVPAVTAAILTAISVLCAVTAILPMARHRLSGLLTVIDATLLGAAPNLAYSAFLALLAAATARRKRVAFGILLAIAVLHALESVAVLLALVFAPQELDIPQLAWGGRWLTAAVCGIQFLVLFLFVLARKEFYARVQRAAVRRSLTVLVVGVLVAIGLGFGLVTLFPGSLATTGERLGWTAETVLGGTLDLAVTGSGRGPGPISLLLGVLGALVLLTSMRVLLQSQRAAARLRPEEELAIRDLLARWGEQDSLGYFATRRDKSAIFARSGRAAVTYRVELGVCLASGDPVGDPDSWQPAIEAWLAQAKAYSWVPAVTGASDRGARAFARAGLRVLEIGDEAVLHTAGFDLQARGLRPVATTVRRLQRSGHTVRIRRHGELTVEQLAAVVALADAWRVGGTERGFSMALSRLGDPADGQCLLVEALDTTGRTVGLQSYVPWGARGLSLDLMRRDRAAENGLTELMVSALAGRGRELGVDRISLNFAVFRSAFEDGARIGAGPVARAWRHLLLFASRWWQLESLYRSNAKYQPDWAPRFLCFAERRELVKISLASMAAEGFFPRTWASESASASASALASGVASGWSSTRASGWSSTRASDGSSQRAFAGPPEQVRIRIAKLARIRERGIEAYPIGYPRTATCDHVLREHAGLAPDTRTGQTVAVAGRVLRLRRHGRLTFVTLRDWSGDLQVMVALDGVGSQEYQRFRADVDLGDLLGVSGEVVTSRTGELCVSATSWTLTAKCLRPLPDKYHGLADPELRVRQRHLDLILRPEARAALAARSAILGGLRDGLRARGFLEVETPQLHAVHGGAAARPFTTHLAALDLPLYLRIAPELYLKRLCVGGVERVFELGRTFRNEGISHKHNPEFTMLEAYQAYADYEVMLGLARDLVIEVATTALGAPIARARDEAGRVVEHDLSGPWPVRTVNQALCAAVGEAVDADTGVHDLQRIARAHGVLLNPVWSRGAMVLELYERLVEAHTMMPTFYRDFPADVSPLTRPHRDDHRLAERWDLVAFGCEVATAYSELVDPVEQRRRLTEQSILAAAGDPEAMQLDEDFLTALEFGMPPTGGLGLGVDRLVMTLTGASIRDTLTFPLARPLKPPAH